MLLLKILGLIDLVSGIAFLMLLFGMPIFNYFLLFCAFLLLIKGLFVLGGDVLSIVDLFSAILLFISLLFALPTFLLWSACLLLFAKGFVSFF